MSAPLDAPVLVTGAGGFIGAVVVAHLRAAGLPIRAGLRRAAPGTAATVICDLDAPETLDAACAGAGTIVHAAGRSAATMAAHLRALLAAADRAGIGRVVLFSSIAVYGAREGRLAEDDVPEGHGADSYGAAKRACEALLRAWAGAAPGRRAAILRPGIVYGRDSPLWIARPVAALRAGVLGDLGRGGDGVAALVHVSDVAEATRLALAALDGLGPALLAANLVGPQTPTWNAYFAALSAWAGLGPLRPLGGTRLAALSALALPAKALGRLGLPAPAALRLVPTRGELRLFARAARHDTVRAEQVLGFRAAIDLADGLADSLSRPTVGACAPGGNGETAVNAASPENAPASR